MPPREHRDEHLFDDRILTHDDLVDLADQDLLGLAQPFDNTFVDFARIFSGTRGYPS